MTIPFNTSHSRVPWPAILPEEGKRTTIARNLGISPRNDFAMLEQIGGECAGAVTFLPEGEALPQREDRYHHLTDKDLAEILRTLPRRLLLAGEEGIRLSLAGAQDKLAVQVTDIPAPSAISAPLWLAEDCYAGKTVVDGLDSILPASLVMSCSGAPAAGALDSCVRKIIHLDMDCFYAAVEMRERPELAGQPVAVGGGVRRGVVTTCNYEARKFGVHSAMPGFQARERCPNLVFLPVRFDLYRTESVKIRSILRAYTPLVEPLSLDEAYLDVTGLDRYAWDIAREIRKRIFEETKLTSSAGIAPNKMLAKIASDWRKPNGQFAITPDQIDSFMSELSVRKIWGVGPKSAEKFEQQGIKTCGDLQKISLAELMRHHGKWGQELYHLCRGHDDRPVEPSRIRKSLSNECTFSDNLTTLEQCQQELDQLVTDLEQELRAKAAERSIHKAFVKVKFADFTRTTRECVSAHPTRETYQALLAEARTRSAQPIRLLGAGVRFVEDEEDVGSSQPWLILEGSKP